MRNMKSMLLTFVCSIIILGLGYFGIVEQGKKILRSESVPERAEYEDVGSNIFYGKIEDDIEIFPWNYYPEDAVKDESGIIPIFLSEELFVEQYLPDKSYAVEDAEKDMKEEGIYDLQAEGIEDPLMQCFIATDMYFSELISCEAGVDEEKVFEWFQVGSRHILQNMVMSDTVSAGSIYFYRNILNLDGKRYQVRIACSDWNVINFVCAEYSPEDRREQEAWKEGKEKMVEVLEQSEEPLSKYFSYMAQLNDMGSPTIYFLNWEYENAYLYGFRWLENIMQGKEEDEELSARINMVAEEWKSTFQENEDTDGVFAVVGEVEYSVNYSYQVVELKDMILLLVQGDAAMGFYFDPINQKFCGYNFFYEY